MSNGNLNIAAIAVAGVVGLICGGVGAKFFTGSAGLLGSSEVNIVGNISTEQQKQSYSFGAVVGPQLLKSIEVSNMQVEKTYFLQGIIDTVNQQTAKLEQEQVADNMQKLQQQANQQAISQLEKTALEKQAQLFVNSDTPKLGNGGITIVEFFDYNCPHCRALNTSLSELTQSNQDIKIVYRPIWMGNQGSRDAALAALAANKQNKFKEFHNALMNEENLITSEIVQSIVKKLKLDNSEFKNSLKDVEEQANKNMQAFMDLGLRGVPSLFAAKLDNNNQVLGENLIFLTGNNPEELANSIQKLKN